jgi:hypothetical protein
MHLGMGRKAWVRWLRRREQKRVAIRRRAPLGWEGDDEGSMVVVVMGWW